LTEFRQRIVADISQYWFETTPIPKDTVERDDHITLPSSVLVSPGPVKLEAYLVRLLCARGRPDDVDRALFHARRTAKQPLYQCCGEMLAKAGRLDDAIALLKEGIARLPPKAAVNAIASEVANIQLRLYQIKGDDHEEQDDYPLLGLLEGANENMTGIELKYVTMAHLELTGNCYWLLDGVTDAMSQPRAIYPLNPGRVRVKLDKARFPYKLSHYEFTIDGKVFRFEPYQIQHFDEHDLSNKSVPPDVLGRAYEFLIKQFADDAGAKFFTPPEVVDTLVRIL
jgi:type I restriction-modification system DNA methylase subunit